MSDASHRREPGLIRLCLATHVGLAIAVAAALASIDVGIALRAILIVLGILPLVATARGLARGSSGTMAWLSVALVAYTGLGTVEVIATGTRTATALFLLALLELGLVLMLTRRLRIRATAAATER